MVGAIVATVSSVAAVRSYEETDALVIGTVSPGSRRPKIPRELFELTLPDGRKVQAYGGVVGQSSPVGATKRVYYDPDARYSPTYEENEAGEPNTSPVYTTLVSVILVPTVLWLAALVAAVIARVILGVKPIHPPKSE